MSREPKPKGEKPHWLRCKGCRVRIPWLASMLSLCADCEKRWKETGALPKGRTPWR